jgi:hypothetical protein
VKRRGVSHRCTSCLGRCRDTPVATETASRATTWSKLLEPRPTVGGAASGRAATCVTPEQASNVKLRGPTGLHNREGRWRPGAHPTDDHGLARRGKGRGTSASHTGPHGRSHAARRAPRSIMRVEPRGKLEGLIVPSAPGGQQNRRGGKEPWCATCHDERRIRSVACAWQLGTGSGDSKRPWAPQPSRRQPLGSPCWTTRAIGRTYPGPGLRLRAATRGGAGPGRGDDRGHRGSGAGALVGR